MSRAGWPAEDFPERFRKPIRLRDRARARRVLAERRWPRAVRGSSCGTPVVVPPAGPRSSFLLRDPGRRSSCGSPVVVPPAGARWRGAHEELLAGEGRYAHRYPNQFAGEHLSVH
ncbi:MAG: hypothetical protein LC799_01490 [Actinobacteria bacterium]|nr:hypothetical protein [Actinomycetota bacterium]